MKKYIFQDKNISYLDYLRTVETLVLGLKDNPLYKECLESGLSSLVKIDNEERRQRIVSASLIADKKFSALNLDDEKHTRKLPTMMTVASLICDYYGDVKNLNDDELLLLGYFSSASSLKQLPGELRFFKDKELLKEVINKTSNINEQMEILWVLENKYYVNEEVNDAEIINLRKEAMSLVKNNSKEDLLNMVTPPKDIAEMLYQNNIKFM